MRYPGARTLALEDVDFAVRRGEVHALAGQKQRRPKSTDLPLGARVGDLGPSRPRRARRHRAHARLVAAMQPVARRDRAAVRAAARAEQRADTGIALIHQELELALALHLSVEANGLR